MKVYEDDYILIYEYNTGIMTIDKNTGLMISWEGRNTWENRIEESK